MFDFQEKRPIISDKQACLLHPCKKTSDVNTVQPTWNWKKLTLTLKTFLFPVNYLLQKIYLP